MNDTPPIHTCLDCVHVLPHPAAPGTLSMCGRSALLYNPVDGTERRRFCENERSDHGACGPEGRHFQPKPDTDNPS